MTSLQREERSQSLKTAFSYLKAFYLVVILLHGSYS